MYRLDIEFREISFDDHPLISEEEINCKQLVSMCNQYLEEIQKELLTYYKKRIEVCMSLLVTNLVSHLQKS